MILSHFEKDDMDYTYGGDDVIAYLCLNAFTMEWGQCGVFTTSVYAYMRASHATILLKVLPIAAS